VTLFLFIYCVIAHLVIAIAGLSS